MAEPDSDLLYVHLLQHAKALLIKNGEMYPIAAKLSNEKQITVLGAYWGDDHPESQRVIDELSLVLKSQAFPGRTSALGLAYDIRFSEGEDQQKRDAIKVDLEHANGESISVIVPYVRGTDGSIELGQAVSEGKPPQWFAAGMG